MWSLFFRPSYLLRSVNSIKSYGGRGWIASLCYCSHESSLSLGEIRQEFSQYGGGQVDLLKDNDSGIATICINNPQKKNALSGHMMVQLADVVQELENWSCGKGLILYSAGNTFCSGGDLSTVSQIGNPSGGLRMSFLMHNTLRRLSMLPLASVAVVQGKALGGGAELTTACDFRLMTPNAEIQFVQVKMGVATGWGGGTRLVHLVGPTLALKLLLSCQKVTASEAIRIGLASDLLDKVEPLKQAHDWLQNYTWGALEVTRAVKSIVFHASCLPVEESLMKERSFFSPLWGGPANQEVLRKNVKHK